MASSDRPFRCNVSAIGDSRPGARSNGTTTWNTRRRGAARTAVDNCGKTNTIDAEYPHPTHFIDVISIPCYTTFR
jgi:hypothetical protein